MCVCVTAGASQPKRRCPPGLSAMAGFSLLPPNPGHQPGWISRSSLPMDRTGERSAQARRPRVLGRNTNPKALPPTIPCESTKPNQLRGPRGAKPLGACTREEKETRGSLAKWNDRRLERDHVMRVWVLPASGPLKVTTLCASQRIPPRSTRHSVIHALRTHTHSHGRGTGPPPPMQHKARSRCTPKVATQHAHAQCRPSVKTCHQEKR